MIGRFSLILAGSLLLSSLVQAESTKTGQASLSTAYAPFSLGTLFLPSVYTIDEIDISIMGDRELFNVYHDTKLGQFYQRNYQPLKESAARGSGQFLDDFAHLLLPPQHHTAFKREVKSDFNRYFAKKIPTFDGLKQFLMLKEKYGTMS